MPCVGIRENPEIQVR